MANKESLLARAIKEKKERHLQNLQQGQSGGEDRLDKLRRNLGKIVVLPLADLVVEGNVRQEVNTDEPEFRQLVASVQQHGVLQNLVVNLQMRGIHTYRLVVVAGQRRLLAAREAGLAHAPALLVEYQSATAAKADGLRENLLRKDLYCLDVAEAYLALVEDGWSETQIAQEFEREPRTIRRYLALARYPATLKELIRQHKELFTARVLLRDIGGRHYGSMAELEAALQAKIAASQPTAGAAKAKPAQIVDTQWRAAEEKLKAQFGPALRLSGSATKGKLTLSFGSAAEWERLLAKLLAGK